jgi:hypothetical protein
MKPVTSDFYEWLLLKFILFFAQDDSYIMEMFNHMSWLISRLFLFFEPDDFRPG